MTKSVFLMSTSAFDFYMSNSFSKKRSFQKFLPVPEPVRDAGHLRSLKLKALSMVLMDFYILHLNVPPTLSAKTGKTTPSEKMFKVQFDASY